ncbi:hypothetical protein SCHPADRAFT_994567 [Schizopora paradoxa]|uniref:Uncharacterized protein n=1 Tax=Schizopora paradoxa TaxID=27342 RepID=A0A0H2RYE2_9AGAM|nr:hypothetical protein SCHPADRAFT_994567 [Schizopora paradoxa]
MNSNLDNEYIPDRSERSGLEGLDAVERGSDEQPTNVDYAAEDREAARSEQTGNVSQREADELRAEAGDLSSIQGRTRGIKNDAMKAERDFDSALQQENPEIVDEDM